MILFSFSSSSWFYSSSSRSKHQKKQRNSNWRSNSVWSSQARFFWSLLPTSNFCSQNHGLHGSLTGLLWLPYAMRSCHHAAWKLASRQNACASRGPACASMKDLESWFGKMERFRSLDDTNFSTQFDILRNSIRRISVDETWCGFSYSLQFLYTMHKIYIYIHICMCVCQYVKNNHLTRLNMWP